MRLVVSARPTGAIRVAETYEYDAQGTQSGQSSTVDRPHHQRPDNRLLLELSTAPTPRTPLLALPR